MVGFKGEVDAYLYLGSIGEVQMTTHPFHFIPGVLSTVAATVIVLGISLQ